MVNFSNFELGNIGALQAIDVNRNQLHFKSIFLGVTCAEGIVKANSELDCGVIAHNFLSLNPSYDCVSNIVF